MARLVVKLGSSIVAHDHGALRVDVVGRVCEEVARRREAGDEVVVVTSGAIARGMQIMGLVARPTAIEDLQAASAVGQGKLYAVYDGLLRERGITTAQVLLTFFDMSARTHYLNARQTLRRLLDLGIVPVVNENDTTTTDEISSPRCNKRPVWLSQACQSKARPTTAMIPSSPSTWQYTTR